MGRSGGDGFWEEGGDRERGGGCVGLKRSSALQLDRLLVELNSIELKIFWYAQSRNEKKTAACNNQHQATYPIACVCRAGGAKDETSEAHSPQSVMLFCLLHSGR